MCDSPQPTANRFTGGRIGTTGPIRARRQPFDSSQVRADLTGGGLASGQ